MAAVIIAASINVNGQEVNAPYKKMNMLKFKLNSVINGHTNISYERVVGKNTTIGFGINMIGMGLTDFLGKNNSVASSYDAKGISQTNYSVFGVGSHISLSIFLNEKQNSDYIIEGMYLKPEIIFNRYNEKFVNVIDATQQRFNMNRDVNSYAMLMNLGYQTRVAKNMVFDVCGALGFSNVSTDKYPDYVYSDTYNQEVSAKTVPYQKQNQFGFSKPVFSSPLVYSLSIRFGYLF